MTTQDQLAREQADRDEGARRYAKAFERARKKGQLASTQPATEIQRRLLGPATEAVQRYADHARRNNRSLHKARYIDSLGADKVAMLGLQHCINGLGQTVATIGSQLAADIETELNLALALKAPECAGLIVWLLKDRYKGASKRFAKEGTDRARRKALGLPLRSKETPGSLLAVDDETGDEELVSVCFSEREAGDLGQAIIHTVCQVSYNLTYRPESEDEPSGLFQVVTEKGYNRRARRQEQVQRLRPTPSLVRYLEDRNEVLSQLRPLYSPMLCEPTDWTTPFDGGYWSHRLNLIKRCPKAHALRMHEEGKLAPLYRAVNALQRTPFMLNSFVVETARALWEDGAQLSCWPVKNPPPLPAKPTGCEGREGDYKAENPQGWATWRRAASEAYKVANSVERMTACAEISQRLNWADKHIEEGNHEFFQVHQVDFRGRFYPVPTLIHTMGDDLQRSSILLGRGKRMTDEGATWLKIHLANSWANGKLDKQPFEARIQWAMENEARILQAGTDPLNDLWWTQADGGDKPFAFLAACHEYAQWIEYGYAFETRLPIGVDAQCNGSQHLAACARNREDGEKVCLTDTGVVADIYAHVANRVNFLLTMSDDPLAAHFFSRISRKEVKRSVMVAPYGGTIGTMTNALRDDHPALFADLERAQRNPAASMLAKTILEAIRYVVRSTMGTMGVIQKLVRAACDNSDKPLLWALPDGVEVQMDYRKSRTIKVKTSINGGISVRRDRVARVQADIRRGTGLNAEACAILGIDKALGKEAKTFIKAAGVLELYRSETELLMENWQAFNAEGFSLARFAARGVMPRPDLRAAVVALMGWVIRQAIATHHLREEAGEEPVEEGGVTKRVIFLAEPLPDQNVTKMVTAASANVTHSLDAAHARATINAALDEGIQDFLFVHDSYGTHCTEMSKLSRILRQQFVELHLVPYVHRLAGQLVESGHITTAQKDAALAGYELGDLDIHETLSSPYFFA